ncbi:hypothetical protein [Aeoliella sp. SH292]|uniref:hypothetical protein n=1 Tax=Aeoliella sp. SH292 TaxID=3454464 RepID=UPI003F9B537F
MPRRIALALCSLLLFLSSTNLQAQVAVSTTSVPTPGMPGFNTWTVTLLPYQDEAISGFQFGGDGSGNYDSRIDYGIFGINGSIELQQFNPSGAATVDQSNNGSFGAVPIEQDSQFLVGTTIAPLSISGASESAHHLQLNAELPYIWDEFGSALPFELAQVVLEEGEVANVRGLVEVWGGGLGNEQVLNFRVGDRNQFLSVLDVVDSDTLSNISTIEPGTQVNLYPGGVIDWNTTVEGTISNPTELNIHGGLVRPNLFIDRDTSVNLFGGKVSHGFYFHSTSEVLIHGNEFRVNGVPVAGLNQYGDSVTIDGDQLPINSIVSGTFEDGTPFAIPLYYGNELKLKSVPLPDPDLIYFEAAGAREGQTFEVGQFTSLTDGFQAGHGSTVNVTDGDAGDYFKANYGSVVNISGGHVGYGFVADVGSSVYISGGKIAFGLRANADSVLNISGGYLRDGGAGAIPAYGSAQITITGGSVDLRTTDNFYDSPALILEGAEFLRGGMPVAGLLNIGDEVTLSGSLLGSELTGTLTDGTPFDIRSGSAEYITLKLADIGSLPASVTVSEGIGPQGIASGRSLTLTEEGTLPDGFRVGSGSVLRVEGGVVSSDLTIMSGGEAHIFAGSVGHEYSGSSGGTKVEGGGYLEMSGGELEWLVVKNEGDATIRGGSLGWLSIYDNSQVTLVGTSFVLDGVNISGDMTPGVPFDVSQGDGVVSGVLQDGTSFSFFESNFLDSLDATSTVRLVLVELLAGDYSGNGTVGIEDYAIWKGAFGTSVTAGTGADGNNDGLVNLADYTIWRDNLGSTLAPPVQAARVPEPATWLLLCGALLLLSRLTPQQPAQLG